VHKKAQHLIHQDAGRNERFGDKAVVNIKAIAMPKVFFN